MAHRAAGNVNARRISYLEAHGTGTVVGDPIEVAALTQAFRASTDATGFCAIGSVKSNIGHLDAAAGMAGLIKTVLALEHQQIPPTINFQEPNPAIDFQRSPFYVNARLADWDGDAPRIAGVSSFGVGGTNSHVILEEAPALPTAAPSSLPQLLVFSAASPPALDTIVSSFRDFAREHPALDLANAAYTLQRGRHALAHRQSFVCDDGADLLRLLDPAVRSKASKCPDSAPKVVFMFTGRDRSSLGWELSCIRVSSAFAASWMRSWP